jgi:hypothetical protein
MAISMPLLLFLTAAVLAACAGCGEEKFTSAWRDREITVDGRYSDWTGPMPYLDKQSMYVGVRNDDEYLYMLLKTVDLRAQMKVLRMGLTLWFSPERKGGGRLGIRYPIGIGNHGIPLFGAEPMRGLSPEQREKLAESFNKMEILGPEQEKWTRIARADSSAIQVAVRDTSEVIVYELRVPLQRREGSGWAVGAAPGDRIVVEAVTGDIRSEKNEVTRSEETQRRETTGKIRDKGRSRDRGRSMEPFAMNPLAEPIRFRARVSLASNPSPVR